MPSNYIIEMICDWWSFSWISGNLTEIFNWYDIHKKSIKLEPSSQQQVESILDKIQKKLEEQK